MAINAEQQQQIIGLTVSMLGVAPGASYLSDLTGVYEQNGEISDVASYLFTTDQFNAMYDGLETRQEKIDVALNNLGIEQGTEAYNVASAHFNARVDQGVSDLGILLEAAEYLYVKDNIDPALADVAQQFENRIDVASYYSIDKNLSSSDINDLNDAIDDVTEDPASVDAAKQAIDDGEVGGTVEEDGDEGESGVPGETFGLTDGRDNLTGTDNDDTFVGLVGQNQNGAVANAFATGDRLDGGAGRDKVEASMINDNETDSGFSQAPRPVTENIEEVYIEALENGNVAPTELGGTTGNYVTLNAGRMNNVEEYWSDNSRGDMFFNDVRLGDKQSITKDVSFGLRDADTSAGIYAAFDTNSLRAAPPTESNSQLQVRVADVTTATPEAPLTNVELDIGFSVGDDDFLLEGVTSEDGTYQGMKNAIEAALADQGLAGYEVSLANPYNQVSVAGNTVNLPFTAQEILVNNPDGNAFSDVTFDYNSIESVDDEFLVAGNAQPVDPNVETSTIETNVELDNAGRGSTAGDVVIGGMSNSNQAIDTLNLEVDRNSKVGQVTSAVAMDPKEGGPADHNSYVAFDTINVTSGEAQGDLSIADVGNVFNFDATEFAGDNLAVSGQAAAPASHVYNTGDSNDTISIDWSTDVAGESADYSLGVNTGGGDDNVHLKADTRDEENDLPNQNEQQNVVVNTGEGNDVIWTEGAGAVNISAGAGNDVVYSDNSGVANATWAFGFDAGNPAGADITNLKGNLPALTSGQATDGNDIPAVMYDAKLRVTFSGAATNGGGVTSGTAAAGSNGFESVVNILEDGEVFGDRTDINNAVMEAINEDNVLGNLLEVTVGPENTLKITSKIDGEFKADDLQIDYVKPNAANFDQNDKNQIESAIQEEANDSNYNYSNAVINGTEAAVNGIEGVAGSVQATDGTNDITGAASEEDNTGNVINLGAGNDVAVLSTNGDSNETIEITGYDNGRNTIVNFDDTEEGAGVDQLDFTDYLTTKVSNSNSAVSEDLVDIAVNAGDEIAANNVTTFDFTSVPNEGFGGITADALVGALNDAANNNYGNLGNITLDGFTSGDFVGDSYNGIVMIEGGNDGVYKAFDVTVGLDNGGDAEATGAELVGVYDFGNELTLTGDSLVG